MLGFARPYHICLILIVRYCGYSQVDFDYQPRGTAYGQVCYCLPLSSVSAVVSQSVFEFWLSHDSDSGSVYFDQIFK